MADTRQGSNGTTKGNENSAKSSQQDSNVDENHKPADKPIQPNQDVEGAEGPIST